jgi:hypothetical protein
MYSLPPTFIDAIAPASAVDVVTETGTRRRPSPTP